MMACERLHELNHLFPQLIFLFRLFTTLTFQFLEKAICFSTWRPSPMLTPLPLHPFMACLLTAQIAAQLTLPLRLLNVWVILCYCSLFPSVHLAQLE